MSVHHCGLHSHTDAAREEAGRYQRACGSCSSTLSSRVVKNATQLARMCGASYSQCGDTGRTGKLFIVQSVWRYWNN